MIRKYLHMTNEQLLAAYKGAMGKMIAPLREAAEIWVEMEERGMDLSPLRSPLTEYFPRIASGALLPEVLFKFAGVPALIDIAATLVPEEQAKVVASGAIIHVATADGGIVGVKPDNLKVAQARQVFGEGRMRTPDEQRQFIPRPAIRATPPSAPVVPLPVTSAPKLAAPAPKPEPDTALAAAFGRAGYKGAEGQLNDLAIEAWAKWPAKIGAGARVQWVSDRLRGDLTWALMEVHNSRILKTEVERLLADADDLIRSAAPQSSQRAAR